ncbi:MAG: PH domain-containing protein [Candidatus Nanoarchaeia archaeon]
MEEIQNKGKNRADHEPLLVVKPLLVNAFFPVFLKNFFFALIFSAILFGISLILEFFNIQIIPLAWSVAVFIFLALILAVIPIFAKIFNLAFTRYLFYETNVVKEFRFILVKRRSVIYQRITNLNVDIDIWDKLCGAGDITLHTADEDPDIVLKYIKHPEEIEHKIYSLIRKENKDLKDNLKEN